MRLRTAAALLAAALTLPMPAARAAQAENPAPDGVLAPHILVVDADDPSAVLFSRAPDKQCIPGSTMKIMTCILTLEQCTLTELVTVPKSVNNLSAANSLMGLSAGETLPVSELLYGLMLESGNDAAIALACHIAGSVAGFCSLMNAKALELGMLDTHFLNASGAFRAGQYSTARDMAKLTAYALQNETFCLLIGTRTHTVPANDVRNKPLELVNNNRCLSDPETSRLYDETNIGGKTGSTVQGGKCLVTVSEQAGRRVIVVQLGALEGGTKGERMTKLFADAKMLAETAFAEGYAWAEADALLAAETAEVRVEGASVLDAARGALTAAADFSGARAFIPKATLARVQADPSLLTVSAAPEMVPAPVTKGQSLGETTASVDGTVWFTGVWRADRNVENAARLRAVR